MCSIWSFQLYRIASPRRSSSTSSSAMRLGSRFSPRGSRARRLSGGRRAVERSERPPFENPIAGKSKGYIIYGVWGPRTVNRALCFMAVATAIRTRSSGAGFTIFILDMCVTQYMMNDSVFVYIYLYCILYNISLQNYHSIYWSFRLLDSPA